MGSKTLVSLGDVLAFHASRNPDRPAVTHEGLAVTYGEIDEAANRRARLLAERGVGKGDLVVIALPNSVEFFEATFAIWKLGATPCPVSPKSPIAELQAIVDAVSPRLIIGPNASTPLSSPILPAGSSASGYVAEALPSVTAPSWKALSSGGSTGRPKVIVTHAPGVTDPLKGGYALQRPTETILNPGPLYHNAAFSAAHHCLFAGGHVVNMARFDAELSLQLIERHGVGYVMFVPTMMARIWRLPLEQRGGFDLSSLQTVIHLGAPCPAWLKEAWIDWLGPERIVEVYAGTEGVGATLISGAEWLQHRGSVGRPVGGAEMRILGDDGREVPTGQVGEVFFRSPPQREGGFSYIGAEPKTQDGWTSLGDLGHIDEDGYLYLSDRRTDLIVSGGVNIYPAEVEAALERHPDVRSSVVIGLPDEDLGSRVHAVVQVAPEAIDALGDQALRDFLAEQLVRYKIPRTFECVTTELKDDAGKVRRSRLRDERIQNAPAQLVMATP